MAINKVVINRDDGQDVLINLTNDTVEADALVVGFTAHDKSGEIIEGANPYAKEETDETVTAQSELIGQLKEAINENVSKTSAEVNTQTDLIQEIKAALEGKAGGGIVLPTLSNPASAGDMAEGKQLIDGKGNVVTGNLPVKGELTVGWAELIESGSDEWTDFFPTIFNNSEGNMILEQHAYISAYVPKSQYGDARPEDVAQGVVFTSENGVRIKGTAQIGGGMVVKSGTTTSRTINTGLSDVEQFFMYKESQTGTGLIHLHYTKSATSRMYASAWTTSNYGSKTITNGTGGVTVSGGTVTISATQAAQGALTSNVTYKWIAIGKE